MADSDSGDTVSIFTSYNCCCCCYYYKPVRFDFCIQDNNFNDTDNNKLFILFVDIKISYYDVTVGRFYNIYNNNNNHKKKEEEEAGFYLILFLTRILLFLFLFVCFQRKRPLQNTNTKELSYS